MKENSLAVFKNYEILRIYAEKSETLEKEGFQSVTNCNRLKLEATGEKKLPILPKKEKVKQ